MAFATVEQLRAYLGQPSLDEDRALLLLDAVTDAIRDGLGWSVTEEPGKVITLDGGDPDGRARRHLFLRTLRLTAVASITDDGVALIDGADFVWSENGIVTRIAGDACVPIEWACGRRSVVATITHGYPTAEVPGIFRTVTLEHTAQLVSNPGQVLRSERVGQVQLTYGDARGATVAGDDPRLDRYRIEPAL